MQIMSKEHTHFSKVANELSLISSKKRATSDMLFEIENKLKVLVTRFVEMKQIFLLWDIKKSATLTQKSFVHADMHVHTQFWTSLSSVRYHESGQQCSEICWHFDSLALYQIHLAKT